MGRGQRKAQKNFPPIVLSSAQLHKSISEKTHARAPPRDSNTPQLTVTRNDPRLALRRTRPHSRSPRRTEQTSPTRVLPSVGCVSVFLCVSTFASAVKACVLPAVQ